MRTTPPDGIFDTSPHLSALALLRIPRSPTRRERPGARLRYGFLHHHQRNSPDTAHNLTRNGKPDDKLLPWVWVCCFDSATKDWTDVFKVNIEPSLVDQKLDAAFSEFRCSE